MAPVHRGIRAGDYGVSDGAKITGMSEGGGVQNDRFQFKLADRVRANPERLPWISGSPVSFSFSVEL